MRLGVMGLARPTGPTFCEPETPNRGAQLGATDSRVQIGRTFDTPRGLKPAARHTGMGNALEHRRFQVARPRSRKAIWVNVLAAVFVLLPPALYAQEADVPPEKPRLDVGQLSAREAVREGNRLLREGDPRSALEAYEQAKTLRPDAPEIPFVEGLAHYALEEYEDARHDFKKTAADEKDQLADDALYSIGATYHAEALKSLQEPEVAIEKLEAAMDQYRQVLADQPDHAAARDANRKAASLRRQVKQMLEQQQQQEQQSDQSRDQQGEDQQDQQNQQQQEGEQEEDSEQEQEQQAQQPDQSEEQPDQQSQQSQAQPDNEQPPEEQQASAAEEEEQEERVSREQAERQLREMMQAIREREEQRRQQVPAVPIAPVEKDW
ncbi:MAG: hypothetical protein KJ749_03430 [Planctomycetes bacterium]|nr:hypothetical protein [Planctomycetota bacterium]